MINPDFLQFVDLEIDDFSHDMNGRFMQYDGNPKLKPSNCNLPFTADHVLELERCKNDIEYFAEKYFHIVNLDEGLIKIQLRDYQQKILYNFINHRHNIVLASRQCGKSTMYEIYLVHYMLFQDHKSAVILANKAQTAISLMGRVREAYQNLPKWLQQGVVEWSKTAMVLENGCSITVSSTSSSAVRGMSVNLLILDELAFVPRNIWDSFFASVYPTISSAKTTKIIMVSTPNGKNHFYKLWSDAEDKLSNSTFHPTKVFWHQVPDRDEEWAKETRGNIGDARFEQEFNISFLGSSHTLITPAALEGLAMSRPISKEEHMLYAKLGNNQHHFKLYDSVKPNHIYSIGVDTSKLSEEIQSDACSVQVIDITTLPFKQVAHFYADRDFSYYELPEVVDTVGSYFNHGTVFVENNEIGQSVADDLWVHYEYESVYFEKGNLPGFRTTKKTKRKGCTDLRTFIENGKLEIVDYETISQLSTFVKKGPTYKAEDSYYDDAVMALIASLHFLQTRQFNHFDDMKKLVAELIKKKDGLGIDAEVIKEEIEEDVPAFGSFGESLDNPGETVF